LSRICAGAKLTSDVGTTDTHEGPLDSFHRPLSGDWSSPPTQFDNLRTSAFDRAASQPPDEISAKQNVHPSVSESEKGNEAFARAVVLSKRLWSMNISSEISPSGDLKLDIAGYKSDEENALKSEVIARKILSEETEGSVDLSSLIGVDETGNLWVYGSEDAKEAADRKAGMRALNPLAMRSSDALSDPGYHSDDGQSESESDGDRLDPIARRDSDSALGSSSPGSPAESSARPGLQRRQTQGRNYAKTLRLTHDQLKSLDLKPGANNISFTVNKATCTAFIYYWRHDVPIVISDIDGTITKYVLILPISGNLANLP
jgi:phosphatidate phosphatase LPIN